MKYPFTNQRNLVCFVKGPNQLCGVSFSAQDLKSFFGEAYRSARLSGADKVRFQMSQCYSSSSGDEMKAEAPIGVQQSSRSYLLGFRLGKSYNHLSRHVNSFLKQRQERDESIARQELHKERSSEASADEVSRRFRNRKRRVLSNKSALLGVYKPRHGIVIDNKASRLREEAYLQFSRRINQYFGAKVTDSVHTPNQMLQTETNVFNALSSKPKETSSYILFRPPSLFHPSSLSTRIGENYSYMARHINQYFIGSTAAEVEEEEMNICRSSPELVQTTPVSFLESLIKPSTVTDFVSGFLGRGSAQRSEPNTTVTQTSEGYTDSTVQGRKQVSDVTRALLNRLDKATEESSLTSCLEQLNNHLMQHPASKALVWQKKSTRHILNHRRTFWMNGDLQEAIRETLALIGYVDPVKGRGVRVLSIDGGGSKGLVPLRVLKELEAQTGKAVHQLFDYICGVSTGAVLAFMLGLARFTLEECEEMYHRFGADVFQQNRLVGTVKMGWTHSYYNTETWEKIIREKIGEGILIKTARDERSPKVSAVSAIVNKGKSPKAFVFRNYNHAPGRLSCYSGASGHQLWQAIRASSAAPGYFQEFPLRGDIHQDGGLLLNNPCAVAVHESRLLWPNQPFQCVLSLGTGHHVCTKKVSGTSTSLRDKISSLICSATDTEGVHTLLDDLLPPNVYFRFNPLLSLNVSLDESRPQVLQQLQADTQVYLERNRAKLEQLCVVLTAERSAVGKTQDWISSRVWELQQRWA